MPLAAGIKSIAAKESLISYHVHYRGWAASVTPCYGAGAAAELRRSATQMEGSMTKEDRWGPIDINRWQEVLHISGRLATEQDVIEGRAVFYLQSSGDADAVPYDIQLPLCAIMKDEETSEETPVIIIQVEVASGRPTVGYRLLDGGNGVGTGPEFTLLKGPDERFV
jgi:hypothetical protein